MPSRFTTFALRILGDPTEAQDATHDVFLKAFHHLHEFRGESGVRTWLYRIAINHGTSPSASSGTPANGQSHPLRRYLL